MSLELHPQDDGVWTLTLNAPEKLNALSDDDVAQLHALLQTVSLDAGCRALIITGVGRGFCAGFDLSLAQDAPGSESGEAAAWTRRQEAFASVVTRLRSLPVPVIAAINGPTNGAGLGLALACDLRLASVQASFNAAFIRVGMSGCDIGVSYLLPRAIGTTHAFELMLTGRMVDAPEAARLGLVSKTCAHDALLDEARQLAQLVASHEGFAVWMTKRGMWANLEAGSLQAALELENRTQILTRTTGGLSQAALALKNRSR